MMCWFCKLLRKVKETELELEKLQLIKDDRDLTEAEEERESQLNRDLFNFSTERNIAKTDMKRFSSFGLFGEGGLGFDAGKLQTIFNDEELANLIKGALKNELFKIVNQSINEAAMTGSNPEIDIKTGVTNTSQIVKQGDTIVGNSDNEIDKHIKD